MIIINTYIHTYIHTYVHTYIRKYTHTYIHTYIHIYILVHRCKGLMILETYTTATDDEIIIPDFMTSESEVTEQPLYSMYNLSLKDYHAMEVRAGATRSPVEFDYRQVYADVEAGTKESGIEMNGFHWYVVRKAGHGYNNSDDDWLSYSSVTILRMLLSELDSVKASL